MQSICKTTVEKKPQVASSETKAPCRMGDVLEEAGLLPDLKRDCRQRRAAQSAKSAHERGMRCRLMLVAWHPPSLPRNRLVADALGFGSFLAPPLFLVRFVFLVIAVEEHDLRIAFEREDVGGDAGEEPAVVRDHHHAASEFEQRVFQRAQGFL